MSSQSGLEAAFWASCDHDTLSVQRCRTCLRWQHPPTIVCRACGSTSLEMAQPSGLGVLVSFTTVHRGPNQDFAGRTPYVLALVDLDEGVRMISHLVGCDSVEPSVGMPVRVSFAAGVDRRIPVFTPASAADPDGPA